MTWSERWACMPSLPPGVTAKLARVRQPRPGASAVPAAAPHPPVQRCSRARRGPPTRGMFDAGEPLELFGQDCSLEAALALQGDVAELGAAHRRVAVGPRPQGIGQVPEMRHPVRARPPGLPRRRRARIWMPRRRRSAGPGLFRPGCAWRTNTTRPSWRATQCPPWATGPTSTTSSAWACGSGCSGLIGYPAVSLLLRTISAATAHWPP